LIVGTALAGLRAIHRLGFKMAKAGVILLDLQSDAVEQQELALEDDEASGRVNLMEALDNLNSRYGRGTVTMASAGLAGDQRAWAYEAGASRARVHDGLERFGSGEGVIEAQSDIRNDAGVD
jgi:hypothetical protein